MNFSTVKRLRKAASVVLATVLMITSIPLIGNAVEVSAEETNSNETTTVWNFRGGREGAYDQKLQGSTGEFEGMTIDATSGKCNSRYDQAGKLDTQINPGTKLIIPVPASSDYTLTILGRDEMVWKIGDVEATKGDASDGTYDEKDEGWGYYYTISGSTDESTTSVTLTLAEAAKTYMKEVKLVTSPTPTPTKAGNGKIDVVDFGAEALAEESYNNLLTVDIANSFYPDKTPGTTGANIGDFTVNDVDGNAFLSFCAGGKTNNRYRTTNEAITRYDAKSKSDANGTEYTGYIYSNNSSTDTVYMSFNLVENDILKVMVGSNGNAATYAFASPSGEVVTAEFTNAAGVEELTFYAAEAGEYKLYCTNEKLVVARATREHTQPVKVTGTSTYTDIASTGAAAPSDYSIAFTNKKTGAVTSAKVKADGTYSTYLYEQYDYSISLFDANGYVVYSDTDFSIAAGAGNQTFNISVKPVEVINITGAVTGLSADALEKLQLDFVSKEVYVPEMAVNEDGTFTLKVEANVEYDVVAKDVNDYELKTTKFVAAQDGTKDFVFEAKPVYDVTVTLDGINAEVAKNAVITLTNINETYEDGKTPYTYVYGASDTIKLRDGQYSVKVTGLGQAAVQQAPIADVKVNGAAAATTAKFYNLTDWNFATLNSNPGLETSGESKYYMGLLLDGAVMENKTYLLANEGGTIRIPVKAGDKVTFEYCYQAAFQVGETVVTSASGSTSTMETTTIEAKEDGYMTVTGINTNVTVNDAEKNVKQTYFTKISVVTPTEYKDTVTVGADKEYKTINAALEAIRTMERTEEQNVTVMIDPGNYEEMLVIDTPNITLKNASDNASIELKNKGVDIDDNAVRVTWYYGHGYSYYSMGTDCKYDEDLLAVNQANGYLSFKNPGTGTTSGSYWNATVVISADNVSADGIIFENSFNQYVSEASVKDTIVSESGAKNGAVKRDDLKEVGDTIVQNKAYVERAACLAIYNNVAKTYFNNCKFIGRQDTLYGGAGSTAAFNECSVYGGTDYIFGGMTAVFKKCDLVFNTSEDKNDVGYITAPQQASGRGYLMYECVVTSTVPGVDTASEYTSKPGYFGRPWQSGTGEAVFYNTTVEATDSHWNEGDFSLGESLINEAGWLNSLSGESALCGEYGTVEKSGVDNLAKRASWATVFTEAKLADGSDISINSFLGDWTPFPELDTAAFTAKLAEAKEYVAKTDVYTAETIANLSAVIAEAEATDVAQLRQRDVNAYVTKLTEAIAALEKITEPTKPETPTEPETPTKPETPTEPETPTKPGNPSTEEIEVVGESATKVTDVALSDDVTFENGVTSDGIKLKVESASVEQAAAMKEALANKGIADISELRLLDISLEKADGTVVKLKSGKVLISLAKEAEIDYSKYDVKIYHLKESGELEEVPVSVKEDTIYFEADSFSPYAIAYVAKADVQNGSENADASAQTGDAAPIAAYALLMAMALLAGFAVVAGKKKKLQ